MTWKHRFEYFLLRAVVFLVGRLPERAVAGFGQGLGDFTFSVLRIRRAVTIENLSIAFPDRSRSQLERTARDCYRHFGRTFLEFARFPLLDQDHFRSRVELRRMEYLIEAKRTGQGLVLCTGHFGNWEAFGARVAQDGFPVWVTAKTQRNPAVDAYTTRAREARGMRVLKVEDGFRRMLRPLRDGEFMTFLIDQDAGRRGIFVDFLGRPASTAIGAVRFARISGCPVVAGYVTRQESGNYIAEFEEPIHLRKDLGHDEAEREALTRLVAQLERQVRAHPEQWFWMHRRWKTRPRPGETGSQEALGASDDRERTVR